MSSNMSYDCDHVSFHCPRKRKTKQNKNKNKRKENIKSRKIDKKEKKNVSIPAHHNIKGVVKKTKQLFFKEKIQEMVLRNKRS